MKNFKSYIIILLIFTSSITPAANFRSDWNNTFDRVWIGQEYWSNPLQDWRIHNGKLECISVAPDRNVHLLTHQLSPSAGSFQMSVNINLSDKTADGRIGFKIGARGNFNDYRNSVFAGTSGSTNKGLDVGITTSGELFIGNIIQTNLQPAEASINCGYRLSLIANPFGKEYSLILKKIDLQTGKKIGQLEKKDVAADKLIGNIALVTDVPCRFSDWRVSGSKIISNEDQSFGPILFAQYTLSENILKMTAQMPPIGKKDSQEVGLEIFENKVWRKIAQSKIDKFSRTANFMITNWHGLHDIFYRLSYLELKKDGKNSRNYFNGTIRKNPKNKNEIIVAAFTGNKDFAFPNTEIIKNVTTHNPDLLFFSGDQIYEVNGGYGFVRKPIETACLDYLRKWYMFGWAFRDLMREKPSVTIPDDHDVYQANLWGASGRKTDKDDKGGYLMSPEFVNMVQRTQSSHLPEPYDAKPVEQNIEVYYTSLNYGRISFAIIEDRKFKSGPNGIVPKTISGRADHVVSTNFDPKTADVPEAKLLGERQLEFLKKWAADWKNADMKILLSQTIFANAATQHGGEKLRLIADYDSNGWPQTGRKKALAEIRKAFAFHIAGDQHLATILKHGINDWNDCGYSFCVPSIAAGYPRSWLPPCEGKDRKTTIRSPGTATLHNYTGKFLDGFGNYITVLAAANPTEILGNVDTISELRAKASGYGIIRLNKKDQTITMECWPLDENPASLSSKQFPGWPKTIKVQDNYSRQAAAFLPTIIISGITNPVFQIINEKKDEIVYTIRVQKNTFRPKVFEKGLYTIKVGNPDIGKMKTFKKIQSLDLNKKQIIKINF